MKIIVVTLALMLTVSFAFANISKVEKPSIQNNILEIIDINQELSKIGVYNKSCTITTGTQVVSNGEVIYQSVNTFTIDGMSCNEFFSLILHMMSQL